MGGNQVPLQIKIEAEWFSTAEAERWIGQLAQNDMFDGDEKITIFDPETGKTYPVHVHK